MDKNIVMTLPKDFGQPKKVDLTLANGMKVEIEVIERLPMEKKVEVIEEITNMCVTDKFNYFNPLFLNILTKVKIIEVCTNINCDTKDLYGFYDILEANGIFEKILPMTEYYDILALSCECASSLCSYKNSFMGAIQTMQSNKENEEIIKQFMEAAEQVKNDPDIKQFMTEVSPHLV